MKLKIICVRSQIDNESNKWWKQCLSALSWPKLSFQMANRLIPIPMAPTLAMPTPRMKKNRGINTINFCFICLESLMFIENLAKVRNTSGSFLRRQLMIANYRVKKLVRKSQYSRVWNRRRAGNNCRAWKICQKEQT